MGSEMSDGISPIEFGRLLGLVEALRNDVSEMKTRHLWRLDDLEQRVETIEKADSAESFPRSVWHKAIWGVIGAGLSASAVLLGGCHV